MARVRIVIKLRPQILDAEGAAVEATLHRNGFKEVQQTRVGKVVDLEVGERSPDVESRLRKMCDDVLINPVMHDYEIIWL